MTDSTAHLALRFETAMADRLSRPQTPLPPRLMLNATCLVGVGEIAFLLDFARGQLTSCRRLTGLLVSHDFAVRAGAAAWSSLWQDPPPPGRHDLLALYKVGEVALEGRLEPFMQHLMFFKDLLASPRKTQS